MTDAHQDVFLWGILARKDAALYTRRELAITPASFSPHIAVMSHTSPPEIIAAWLLLVRLGELLKRRQAVVVCRHSAEELKTPPAPKRGDGGAGPCRLHRVFRLTRSLG